MARVLPSAAPFPYTTLFRSQHAAVWPPDLEIGRRLLAVELGQHRDPLPLEDEADRLLLHHSGQRTHLGLQARVQRSPQDRKSTRLNSSHGYISYAVFCLKKK